MFRDNPILDTFCNKVQAFADAYDNHGLVFIPRYVKNEDDLLSLTDRLYFSRFYFNFVYILRSGNLVGSRSMIKCLVWLDKGKHLICHTLYDLQFLLDPNDFHCYIFPYIKSPARMELCFKTLAEAAVRYLSRITQIAGTPELLQKANDVL